MLRDSIKRQAVRIFSMIIMICTHTGLKNCATATRNQLIVKAKTVYHSQITNVIATSKTLSHFLILTMPLFWYVSLSKFFFDQ